MTLPTVDDSVLEFLDRLNASTFIDYFHVLGCNLHPYDYTLDSMVEETYTYYINQQSYIPGVSVLYRDTNTTMQIAHNLMFVSPGLVQGNCGGYGNRWVGFLVKHIWSTLHGFTNGFISNGDKQSYQIQSASWRIL